VRADIKDDIALFYGREVSFCFGRLIVTANKADSTRNNPPLTLKRSFTNRENYREEEAGKPMCYTLFGSTP